DVGIQLFLGGDAHAALFGEDQPGVLLALPPADVAALRELLPDDVELTSVGLVEGDALQVRCDDRLLCELPISALRQRNEAVLPAIVSHRVSSAL
ncbi:MAG: hypothetical protein ACO3JL_18405, partial [Myxococcota bacterium]